VASAGLVQVCTSLQTDNHASTPPLSFLQAGCPSCRPTNSVKALKAPAHPLNNIKTISKFEWLNGKIASANVNDQQAPTDNKKLSYRRGTARCVVSIEILPIGTQQCRNYLYDKS